MFQAFSKSFACGLCIGSLSHLKCHPHALFIIVSGIGIQLIYNCHLLWESIPDTNPSYYSIALLPEFFNANNWFRYHLYHLNRLWALIYVFIPSPSIVDTQLQVYSVSDWIQSNQYKFVGKLFGTGPQTAISDIKDYTCYPEKRGWQEPAKAQAKQFKFQTRLCRSPAF